jgi:hypothetical protein
VSPSPQDASNRAALDDYGVAWTAILKAARAGNSWSGHEGNRTFLNTGKGGGGQFAEVSYLSGFGMKDDGRALAIVDWDGDGDLDLWARNRSAPRLRLMRNRSDPASSRSVSFRLVGRGKSNRDAIGARLRLELSDGSQQIATVRAGSGFLSQSSKSVHFGFAPALDVRRLVVRWPDGEEEIFGDLGGAEHGRISIQQGRSAERIPLRGKTALRAGALAARDPDPGAQVILPGRIPLPGFRFTPTGEADPVGLEPGAHPLVIVLFSGACGSCSAELSEFANHAEQIRESGLDVLALSVDGLSATPLDGQSDEQLLAKGGFNFPSGRIDLASADHLRFLLSSLFDYPAHFSVPLSLLLDERRRLFAIYRGRVPVEMVLRDSKFSNAGRDKLRDLAIPFRGRWFTSSITEPELLRFVATPFKGTFPAQYLRYLEELIEGGGPSRDQAQRRHEVAVGYLELARKQAAANALDQAAASFEKSLQHAPDSAVAHNDYGALLANRGEFSAAKKHFERALALRPGYGQAQQNLERLQPFLK